MRKHMFLLCASLATLPATVLAQTSTWVPDKAHSSVTFSVLHLGLSKVRGHFGNISGTIEYDSSQIAKSKVDVTIDVTTVDTGEPTRDQDLKSANFFDVAQYPTATFSSTRVTPHGAGFEVAGDLTLHGVTRPVVLEVDAPTGPVTGMDKKPHSGFSATTTIDRTAFGIGPKYPAAVVGDKVSLSIDLDVAKQ